MKIFIANIDSISKNPDKYMALLSKSDQARISSFQKQTRKLQFILGHLMADNCGEKYNSIAHRDNLVVVAASNFPVGIDIENTTIERDFVASAELMNLATPKSLGDFYKSFTESEAVYKLGVAPKCIRFINYSNYLICVVSTNDFEISKLSEFDIDSLVISKQK